ncbi:hypothetical protein BGZ50_005504, partial [Haplosporangium sp. Z 11]
MPHQSAIGARQCQYPVHSTLTSETEPDVQMDWLLGRCLTIQYFFHQTLYLFTIVSIILTIFYQTYLPSNQLEARNWIGFFLPLLTFLSEPKIHCFHQGALPLMFISWMALTIEWFLAYSDTSKSAKFGYAPHVKYAHKVGCVHDQPDCASLFWYLITIAMMTLCIAGEMAVLLWIEHGTRENLWLNGTHEQLMGCHARGHAHTSNNENEEAEDTISMDNTTEGPTHNAIPMTMESSIDEVRISSPEQLEAPRPQRPDCTRVFLESPEIESVMVSISTAMEDSAVIICAPISIPAPVHKARHRLRRSIRRGLFPSICVRHLSPIEEESEE